MKMTFGDLEKYLKSKGLREMFDYNISLKINNLDLHIDKQYFISVGECTEDKYEVFASFVGAEVDENNIYITDGNLYQYKIYDSLKMAVDFALKCRENRQLPKEYIQMW